MTTRRRSHGRREVDAPRRAAWQALQAVTVDDAYANLVVNEAIAAFSLTGRDAAFVTELVSGTCRFLGTYDAILEAASGRSLDDLDADVVDVLRLGTHQALAMRVPAHAAVAATVDLAAVVVGERVAGLTNAVMRKVLAHTLDEWLDDLAERWGLTGLEADAWRAHHPDWIAEALARVLPADEVGEALAANNVAPATWLVTRPGISTVDELVAAGATASDLTPVGALWSGAPSAAPGVAEARVGVQDPGSQLVGLVLGRADAPAGHWLDLCAGPGGKAALLAGLALARGEELTACEVQPHRARLVEKAVRAYRPVPRVITGDGRDPGLPPASFARVMADVPCSGLGALRRRPEARWRRSPDDVTDLHPLQLALLRSAMSLTMPGGLTAYVTCSPHPDETVAVVEEALAAAEGWTVVDAPAVLAEITPRTRTTVEVAGGRAVQLWPHRHGTDAMFLALLRAPGVTAG